MPDSNFNIQLADINAHTTHSERTEVERKKKQQLKARNSIADGTCRSQTACIPHRKYRCLNWIFMRVRVWQAAWFEYHFFFFIPMFNFFRISDYKIRHQIRTVLFFFSSVCRCEHHVFLEGRSIFICTGRMTKNNRNGNSIVRFIQMECTVQCKALKKWVGRNLVREIIMRCFFLHFFFSWCGEYSFNKLTLFFFDGISAGFFMVVANSMIIFFREKKKTNAQSTWVKRSSIILLLFIFSPNERWLWGGDRHFARNKASCCLITLCKLAFQIM